MPASLYLKLPFSFDVPRLRQDLAKIPASAWIDHFNAAAYETGWSCVPLRSVGGRTDHIMSVDGATYADTELLATTPYFREVIDAFPCAKTSVRLMALEAGCVIKEHMDPATCCDDGVARFNVPIQTAPEVLFIVAGEPVHFSLGDTWYLNAGARHGVRNDSPRRRVHLMLDCIVNPWLNGVLEAAGLEHRAPAKYEDPSITDANVEAVIASLLAQGGSSARGLAERLNAIRQGQA